jgi:hypothetical protein
MNEPIPLSEMKKILEDRFKILWATAFDIIEPGDMHIGDFRIKKDNKEQIAHLKELIKEMESNVIEYRNECVENFGDSMIQALKDDLTAFKNEIFAKKLWTVHSALTDMSNPELDRYRESFENATAKEIYEHTKFILEKAKYYVSEKYPMINLKTVHEIKDLNWIFYKMIIC